MREMSRRRPQGHPHPDLLRPLAHHVGDDAVDPHRAQQEGHRSGDDQEEHGEGECAPWSAPPPPPWCGPATAAGSDRSTRPPRARAPPAAGDRDRAAHDQIEAPRHDPGCSEPRQRASAPGNRPPRSAAVPGSLADAPHHADDGVPVGFSAESPGSAACPGRSACGQKRFASASLTTTSSAGRSGSSRSKTLPRAAGCPWSRSSPGSPSGWPGSGGMAVRRHGKSSITWPLLCRPPAAAP